MSLLKVNEVQNYNGSSLTLTASTVSTSAQLNTGGNISVTGSINVSDDSTTRSNLGLGSMATQDSSNVSVTGGTIQNATLESSVSFPSIGQLAFWHGRAGSSSNVTFTLDGTSSYTVFFNGRNANSPFNPKNLTFIINSSDGTITNKTDYWGTDLNESFNNSTKVLTLTSASANEIMSILIFKGAITEGT